MGGIGDGEVLEVAPNPAGSVVTKKNTVLDEKKTSLLMRHAPHAEYC